MSLDRRSLRTRKITRSNSGNSCRASRRFNLREAERFQKGGRLCRNLFFHNSARKIGKGWLCLRDKLTKFERAVYLSGEDPRFYKRGIGQYPARLSGGFQSPTEINASATQCSTGALLRMLRHGGSQPYREEGASHHARRGKNAEAFLKYKIRRSAVCII